MKLEVSPHTGLPGHVVDFIELDGNRVAVAAYGRCDG